MQPQMRQSTDPAREPTASAVGASPSADDKREALRIWLRNLGISFAAGVFLAAIGAMDSGRDPFLTRLLYWVPLMVGGALVADLVVRLVQRIPRIDANIWVFGTVLSFAITLPIAILVWSYTSFIFGQPLRITHLPGFLGPVFTVAAAMTAIMIVVNRPGRVTHAPAEGAPPVSVRFMERLPAKLKGAVIYAVSAEDHYLRLHTSKGADLILMRLADAIIELDGLEGAQTHRSWWVARDAVEDARREGDRAVLVLKGGVEAPVSRPNVKPLKDAGWF